MDAVDIDLCCGVIVRIDVKATFEKAETVRIWTPVSEITPVTKQCPRSFYFRKVFYPVLIVDHFEHILASMLVLKHNSNGDGH